MPATPSASASACSSAARGPSPAIRNRSVRIARPKLRGGGQQDFVRLFRTAGWRPSGSSRPARPARVGALKAVRRRRRWGSPRRGRPGCLPTRAAAPRRANSRRSRARSDRPAAAARSAPARLVGVQLPAAADADRHAGQRRGRQREGVRVEIAGLDHRNAPRAAPARELRGAGQVAGTAKPLIGNAVTGAHASTRGEPAPSR